MSQADPEKTDTLELVAGLLAGTQDEEIDCDQFLALLPQIVEGHPFDEKTRELIETHRKLCPECAEEQAILLRALGLAEVEA